MYGPWVFAAAVHNNKEISNNIVTLSTNVILIMMIMILKPTPEMPMQAHRPGNGSSILNRQVKQAVPLVNRSLLPI